MDVALAIAKKDWYEVRQNRMAWLPMLIIPVIFVVAIPLLFLLGSQSPAIARDLMGDPDIAVFMENLPLDMLSFTEGLNPIQSGLVMMLGVFFAPFFLMMPIMFASVIASESFAGEMERKTLEALLYTPITDIELIFGKVLAAAIPSILITWGSFVVYTLVLNLAGWPLMSRIWFPLPNWYPLIFWITPALAVMSLSLTVLISARVKTFMGAYQSSSSLVLLTLALLAGQATGVLYLNTTVGLVLGLVLWVFAAGAAWLAVKKFNRKTILISS
jgi:ABC-type Na+ efflux pump permease subunit